MDARKDILWRVYALYAFMCLFGIAIIAQVINVQFLQGEKWRTKAETLTTEYREIEAARGNIFASDGSLLATSFPIYEVRMDVCANPITDKIFNVNLDSLAYCLSNLFSDKSKLQYKSELRDARKNKERYFLIRRNVSYVELQKMKKFPLFREGKYKGGLITLQQSKRAKPFQELAGRTIGYERPGIQPIGLEGAYNSYLSGVGGKRLMQKIAGGVWKPLNDDNEIEPQDGMDLVSTIDINIQDVAENALLTQLQKHNADHGCAVLMEVETGEIRAIANLGKSKTTGEYGEYYNYAIGEATEPGSTFKLASVIALLEDGLVDITDIIDTKDGTFRFYDRIMKDSDHNKGGHGKITLQQAFELSSNVGISRMVVNNYSKDPQKFIDRIYSMNLQNELGLEIPGEGKPKIKNTKEKDWSGVSLPWMSIGYEMLLTPMQILAFYNAVANNGKMVRPKLVKEITKNGIVEKKFETEIINPKICSRQTIDKVKLLLEGVVDSGTAKNLKHADYKIAGKTGTAQIAKEGVYKNQKITYQASFVGYFPAENPKYSCIVVVNAPSNNVYYANQVAGPIFKEISDKVYSSRLDINKELQDVGILSENKIPYAQKGNKKDLLISLQKLNVPLKNDTQNASCWVIAENNENTVELKESPEPNGIVPHVVGMGARDAIYILENLGLRVKIEGHGTVVQQSINAGTEITSDREITLRLS